MILQKAGNYQSVWSHNLEEGNFNESVTVISLSSDKTLVRFEVLTAVLQKIQVFWNVTLCC